MARPLSTRLPAEWDVVLRRLYVTAGIPTDHLPRRGREAADLYREFRRLTGCRWSWLAVWGYMVDERKRGRWPALFRKKKLVAA